ncbi:uncharacterized protein LOC129599757 [Paramacrobiotus metropolitanus]|uniref:uncharacterized protein LOC129599757 n=1 Tax=Paramacrobiotus metropolitanus TaxID=2943436 RepID=UPI002445AF8B|nr:uncharacterized protein LOC129599757 [Paramacrobiotus metropolitanus]
MFVQRPCDVNVVYGSVLLHGRVVDVANNGMYIDLMCHGRRRELIPFPRLFLSKSEEFSDWAYKYLKKQRPNETVPVEILRRECPGGAWRWWPGKMLTLTQEGDPTIPTLSDNYATVVVVQGQDDEGASWTDVVPKQRLRYPVSDSFWTGKPQAPSPKWWPVTRLLPVAPARFIQRRLPLPAECRGASVAQVVEVIRECQSQQAEQPLASRGRVVWVDVADEHLLLKVKLHGGDGCAQRQAEHMAQKIVGTLLEPLFGRLPGILRAVQAPVEAMDLGATSDESLALGADEWQEVFAHLVTLTRQKLRVVCPAWDAILDLPTLTASIIVETEARSKDLPDLSYALTAPLFKCLRSSTQYVVLHDRAACINRAQFYTVLKMIRHVSRNCQPAIRLTALYVVGFSDLPSKVYQRLRDPIESCDVHEHPRDHNRSTFFKGFLQEFIAVSRSVTCETISLVRCPVKLEYNLDFRQQSSMSLALNVDMAKVRLSLSGDFAATVWNAVEALLPAPSDGEVRALSAWLASISTSADERHQGHRMAVCNLLCATQTADPRSSLHYRGKKWCSDGLYNLCVPNLSRTALCFLLVLCKRCQ